MLKGNWNCIVVTCPSLQWASAIEKELKLLQKKGFIAANVHLLTVEDPADKIGSGAATLNALLVITEFLSALNNFTVITADVLHTARLLILHHGRGYVFDPCGKAFINVPKLWSSKDASEMQRPTPHGIYTSLEVILEFIDNMAVNSPHGLWVSSTDMLLLPNSKEYDQVMQWKDNTDVILFCVPADISYATGHGTVCINSSGFVENIIYCGNEKVLSNFCREGNKVPLVSGLVYLSTSVVESLLAFHTISPLNSCNYLGMDSGAEPLQVSLFFDILISMASGITKETFLSGKCGKSYNQKFGISEKCMKTMERARKSVWEELSQYKMTSTILQNYLHFYWSGELCARNHVENIYAAKQTEVVHSYIEGEAKIPECCILINCLLNIHQKFEIQSKSVICHTYIEARNLSIGKDCFISGVKGTYSNDETLMIQDETVLLGYCIFSPTADGKIVPLPITVIMGLNDALMLPVTDVKSTCCNMTWTRFFEKSGICAEDLWDNTLEPKYKTLMNAKLYPISEKLSDCLWLMEKECTGKYLTEWKKQTRLSLSDILNFHNHEKEFRYRRELSALISRKKTKDILLHNEMLPVIPYFLTAAAEEWGGSLLKTLDEVCGKTEGRLDVAARTLSCIADLLGTMAGKMGGVRSGPGSNKAWLPAFDLLQSGKLDAGMYALVKAREHWLDSPIHMMRAARHYESALQILIRNAVSTASQFIEISSSHVLPIGQYVIAECPARIDLQGGWTDTPPICYELGGSVVNMAVLIDGMKPVGARGCRINQPEIVLVLGKDNSAADVIIKDIDQLRDYNQPNAEASLLKAAIICAGIVDIEQDVALPNQLIQKYQGGFKVQTWSQLPQGSGLGTSSILAAAVISVLWTISARSYTRQSIINAVLHVEQLLTTGGGWQDQVGGVIGGVKRGYSLSGLPLHVEVEQLCIDSEFVQKLNDHLILLYTGKVRLAKNLLQNVIRNWYAREEVVVECFKSLLQCSMKTVDAFQKRDLQAIGDMMNMYWKQKKLLAPGCEPQLVKEMMNKLAALCYGQLLVGAGGGGFMCILTKEPHVQDLVMSAVSSIKGSEKITFHHITVESTGIDVRIDGHHLDI